MAQSKISKFWNSTPAVGKVAIIGGAGIGAFLIGRAIYKSIESARIKSQIRLYERSNYPYTTPSGQVTSINLADIAQKIHDAIDKSWYEIEDESTAVYHVLKVPVQYLKELADIYQRLYNKSIYELFNERLDDPAQIGQVQTHFRQANMQGLNDQYTANQLPVYGLIHAPPVTWGRGYDGYRNRIYRHQRLIERCKIWPNC
ncbi:MAG: hypothetical protein JRI75_04910 [Deltaproteobacteria bacterium]|nr:hypothetical protein [Deltaproteobacteria bacterium]